MGVHAFTCGRFARTSPHRGRDWNSTVLRYRSATFHLDLRVAGNVKFRSKSEVTGTSREPPVNSNITSVGPTLSAGSGAATSHASLPSGTGRGGTVSVTGEGERPSRKCAVFNPSLGLCLDSIPVFHVKFRHCINQTYPTHLTCDVRSSMYYPTLSHM